jgi:hypothetical protein
MPHHASHTVGPVLVILTSDTITGSVPYGATRLCSTVRSEVEATFFTKPTPTSRVRFGRAVGNADARLTLSGNDVPSSDIAPEIKGEGDDCRYPSPPPSVSSFGEPSSCRTSSAPSLPTSAT